MISEKTLKSLEFDKVLANLSKYAVLDATKNGIENFYPVCDFAAAQTLLDKTREAYSLLYDYGLSGVFYFADISEELKRADAGGTLNNGELLRVHDNLKSARMLKAAVSSVKDEKIRLLRATTDKLYVNSEFEDDISSKIISEDEISDNASPRLYSIRKKIRDINADIREKLNSYMRTGLNKYLQDSVVTMRQERFVIPVKSEFRSQVKGFIHDQSSSGSTVFIEPEQVMELNNDLKRATFEEKEEIYRILSELTQKVTCISEALRSNALLLSEADGFFARAEYAFRNKCSMPVLNRDGVICLKKARHPLILPEKVVPVSLKIGKDFRFLLITGPNTGGKTVTLKLVGLFALMAMSGIFIPAEEESEVSVFDGVFCDIGDEQSIEQDLSTFSSHVNNIIRILSELKNKSLILLDELGAGTDPEEGSALALAIIDKLLKADCFGIITTHYSALKEYAALANDIENASMEFDAVTLKPLYKINVGIPGSSNAIEIAKTLGLPADVIENAMKHLTSKHVDFENVLKKAEESYRETERLAEELNRIKAEKESELQAVAEEKKRIQAEREKIYFNAKQKTKSIVADKLAEAEEIVSELKSILKRAGLESKEAIRAAELKNRLENSRYLTVERENAPIERIRAKSSELAVGNKVYVQSLDAYAKIISLRRDKREAEVLIGDARVKVGFSELYNPETEKSKDAPVKVFNKARSVAPQAELNVIGKTSLEAISELEAFMDQAVLNGLNEVKIVHGVGAGVLKKAIREYLKADKRVAEFRRGQFGEGEDGVTIVKLK